MVKYSWRSFFFSSIFRDLCLTQSVNKVKNVAFINKILITILFNHQEKDVIIFFYYYFLFIFKTRPYLCKLSGSRVCFILDFNTVDLRNLADFVDSYFSFISSTKLLFEPLLMPIFILFNIKEFINLPYIPKDYMYLEKILSVFIFFGKGVNKVTKLHCLNFENIENIDDFNLNDETFSFQFYNQTRGSINILKVFNETFSRFGLTSKQNTIPSKFKFIIFYIYFRSVFFLKNRKDLKLFTNDKSDLDLIAYGKNIKTFKQYNYIF